MLVTVSGFRMTFGRKTVIDDLSFDVKRGETFGFLGSNGSGKTTTLRALLGMITPTAGQLLIDNIPFTPAHGTRVGYLPEERGLYAKEPVNETMAYFAELAGLSRKAARTWCDTYLERVGLADKRRMHIGKLSGGQQQKIQLGIAIMGEPELLILDEPTKGLDPVNRQLLTQLITEQHDAGATVILVTHHMDDVERLCDRALLLRNGKAEAYGTIREIQNTYGGRRIRLRVNGPLPASELFTITSRSGDIIDIAAASHIRDEEILGDLVRRGVNIAAFEPRTTSLDEIFVQIYTQTLTYDAA